MTPTPRNHFILIYRVLHVLVSNSLFKTLLLESISFIYLKSNSLRLLRGSGSHSFFMLYSNVQKHVILLYCPPFFSMHLVCLSFKVFTLSLVFQRFFFIIFVFSLFSFNPLFLVFLQTLGKLAVIIVSLAKVQCVTSWLQVTVSYKYVHDSFRGKVTRVPHIYICFCSHFKLQDLPFLIMSVPLL